MATPPDMKAREDRLLAEFSELALELARNLQARAMAAEDTAEAAQAALAFHSVGRSLRQTLALHARREREHQRDAFDDGVQVVRARSARVERRKAQVKLGVERMVWTEAEPDEAERLLDELDDLLEMDVLSDAFTGDEPIETHIARLCEQLGVSLPTSTLAAERSSPAGGGVGKADGGGSIPGSSPLWRSSG